MHVRDELGCSRMLGQIKDLFSNRCAVEVVHHGLRTEMEHALWAIKCAESGHLPWVITNDVRYATIEQRAAYDTLRCLKANVPLSKAGSLLTQNGEWFLKSPRQMWHRWESLPGGLSMSVDIADQCGFRLEMVTMPLPETEVPSDFKNADQYLRHLVFEGAERRWSTHVTAHHHAQIEEN